MNYLKTLKLRFKLFSLFAIVTISLITTSIVGTIYIDRMKKQIDILYFKYFIQNIELNKLKDLYISINKTNRSEKLKKIEKLWSVYSKHYKSKDELAYFKYLDGRIKSINKSLKKDDIKGIVKDIKKLIEYKNKQASIERKKFLSFYDKTLEKFHYIIYFIILVVLGTIFYVFYSINEDQEELEKLNQKLKDASIKDPLTKLYNRRFFNIIFEKELKNSIRFKAHITFMMIDIDYFKQYNDTYGHLEGDNALISVADALRETFKRPKDYIFRLGGEEFGVLLIGLDKEYSIKMAQMLAKNVKDKKIEHKGSKVNDYLTISIGIFCKKGEEGLNTEDFTSKADDLLYLAKKNGRNRFEIN